MAKIIHLIKRYGIYLMLVAASITINETGTLGKGGGGKKKSSKGKKTSSKGVNNPTDPANGRIPYGWRKGSILISNWGIANNGLWDNGDCTNGIYPRHAYGRRYAELHEKPYCQSRNWIKVEVESWNTKERHTTDLNIGVAELVTFSPNSSNGYWSRNGFQVQNYLKLTGVYIPPKAEQLIVRIINVDMACCFYKQNELRFSNAGVISENIYLNRYLKDGYVITPKYKTSDVMELTHTGYASIRFGGTH